MHETHVSFTKHTNKEFTSPYKILLKSFRTLLSQEGFISNAGSLKGVQHVILLSQVPLSVSLFIFMKIYIHTDTSYICDCKAVSNYIKWHYCGLIRPQLPVYRGSSGIQALMKGNARKLAEQDESTLMASGIPYTIIRTGALQNTPGGKQGFQFEEV